MKISVECYSGYRGEETPRRLMVGQDLVEVLKILERSLSPGCRRFKVLGSDQAIYLLRCDEQSSATSTCARPLTVVSGRRHRTSPHHRADGTGSPL